MKTLKSLMLIAAMGIISYSAIAQKKTKDVPAVVTSAFANQYPQVTLKSWSKDRDQYIASFKYNNRDWMAHYSADGNWLRSDRSIKHMASLPAGIRMAIRNSKYASYHVDEIANLQMPDHSNLYRVRVDNNNGNKIDYQGGGADNENLYFSPHGRLVRTTSGNE